MHINDFGGGGVRGSNSAFRGQPKFWLNYINNNNNKTEKVGAVWKRLVRALTQTKVHVQ